VFFPPLLDRRLLVPPRLRLLLDRAAAIVTVIYHPLLRRIGRLEDRTYLLSSFLFPSLDAPLQIYGELGEHPSVDRSKLWEGFSGSNDIASDPGEVLLLPVADRSSGSVERVGDFLSSFVLESVPDG